MAPTTLESKMQYTYTKDGNNGMLTKNPFRYRGYYYDTGTGFYNLDSWYYAPKIRRCISADEVEGLGAVAIDYILYILKWCQFRIRYRFFFESATDIRMVGEKYVF